VENLHQTLFCKIQLSSKTIWKTNKIIETLMVNLSQLNVATIRRLLLKKKFGDEQRTPLTPYLQASMHNTATNMK